MSNYPLPKDPIQAAYLDHLRQRNVRIASVCHYCKSQSTGINSDGYRILFVCDDHFEAGTDVILDTTNPNVIHRTYPNGKEPGLMDPNVGGYLNKTNEEAIWSTQISFEE